MFEPVARDSSAKRGGASRKVDDQLYGKLLETNAALKDAGGVLIIVYALILLTAYLALGFGWYKSLPLLQQADLNVVWMYLIVFVVVFFIWIAHFEFLQWWCYRRHRSELLDQVQRSFLQWWCYRRHRSELLDQFQRSALNRYDLLAWIADDKSVSIVAEALKRDRWSDASHRFYVEGGT
jgi:hypothetical protein